MTTSNAKTTTVDLHDRTKNTQFFLSNKLTGVQAPVGAVTPTEHAGNGSILSCNATARDFSIVTKQGSIVFFPKGSVWIPESLQGHPYLAAQGVTLT